MEQSKKPKTSSEFSFSDESSASSSSSPGRNLSPEEMVEVKKEPDFNRKVQKADREKIRRDKLNEQFLELGDALDPNRPKSDRASILTDTIQILKDLMNQVDKLKAEYVTLSQESLELSQEKSELREEKSSLKSDIEILNAQYQHRVRAMVPWIPHYAYPVPVVAMTQGSVSIQPFPLHGTQDPETIPNPCSTLIPYSAQQASNQHPCPSSCEGFKSKYLDMNLMRNSNYSDKKDDVGLELELKIQVSSSAQDDVPGKEKKGNSDQHCKLIE